MKIKKIDIRDIDGFILGNAEDPEGGTGVTVIISEEGAIGGVDVRGGGPATRETDLLRSENSVQTVNAVVLSGGSAYGLEAASGVMRSLAERKVGFSIGDITVPIVTGASLFDLAVGRSDVFPDREMGMKAVENAYSGVFGSGNHGAGTGASCGKSLGMDRAMKTGLGTYACGDDRLQVGAIAAVNAVADVYNGAGNIIAGLRSGDGSSIVGTIRILKDMIYPESAPDVDREDFRANASSRFRRGEPDKSEPETRSDIARAIMEAYAENEKSDIVDNAPQDISDGDAHAEDPEIVQETVSAEEYPAHDEQELTRDGSTEGDMTYAEPEISQVVSDVEYTAYDEPEITKAGSSEEDTVSEAAGAPAADIVTSGIADEPGEPDAADQTAAEQPSGPEYVDPYELSEEEKADLGYDIPFNTTIACLITNAVLTKPQANKLASILHDAYARAIKPVHSSLDGDTIFVLSTCRYEVNFDAFAALATDVMQYAVIDGALAAEGAYGLPASRDIMYR